MSKPSTPRAAAARPASPFTPAPARTASGWTPARQTAFIEALSQSGCVHEACRAVGLSRQSAYALRMRTDAQGFRLAWDAALDLAIRRLTDECLSRALHGEAVPVFFQGEQIGERRRYDNRLAMFLLRYRDPLRYAASLDQMVYDGQPEGAALGFARARDRMAEEAHDVADTPAAPPPPPYRGTPIHAAIVSQREELTAASGGVPGGSYERRQRILARRAQIAAEQPPPPRRTRGAELAAHLRPGAEAGKGGDVVSTSSTYPPSGPPGRPGA